jgi:hypothetical protein
MPKIDLAAVPVRKGSGRPASGPARTALKAPATLVFSPPPAGLIRSVRQ